MSQSEAQKTRAQLLAHAKPPTTQRQKARGGARGLFKSILDTCRSLEGSTTGSRDVFHLGEPPSGLMTVDFSHDNDDGWRKNLPTPHH
ncbi:hypothetical protein GGS20DRAFT_389712 [Poronia punctata]|nr:hypothetical protein GGS20DRAFT_389712 [Poronia punctata]